MIKGTFSTEDRWRGMFYLTRPRTMHSLVFSSTCTRSHAKLYGTSMLNRIEVALIDLVVPL